MSPASEAAAPVLARRTREHKLELRLPRDRRRVRRRDAGGGGRQADVFGSDFVAGGK